MKKLLIIGSTLFAFSAVSLFANNTNAVYNGNGQATITDTVPKKDSTKKKDTVLIQLRAPK
jgi:hypothetical protein